MAGKVSRSQACDHCRRRRIRCDQGRPQCLRCVKAKLICGGYRPFTVVQYDPANGSSKRRSRPQDETFCSEHSRALLTSLSDVLSTEVIPLDPKTVYLNYAHSNLLANGTSHVRRIFPVKRDLSDRSFLALATYHFGHHYRNQDIIDQGLQQYGSVLRELNEALANDTKRGSFDTLDSVIVMIMFEVSQQSNN